MKQFTNFQFTIFKHLRTRSKIKIIVQPHTITSYNILKRKKQIEYI